MKIAPSARFVTALLAGLTLLSAAPASAQRIKAFDELPTHDSAGDAYNQKYYLVRPKSVAVSLAHAKGGRPDEFVLRMTATEPNSGCPKLGQLAYEMNFQDIYMLASVSAYSVDLRDLPLAPQYQCAKGYQYPSAEIPLSVSTLKDNKTAYMRFQAGKKFDTYEVKLNDHSIQLYPSNTLGSLKPTYGAMQIANVKNPLKLWFYPEGTVILRASGTPEDTINLQEAMDSFASDNGLEPLKESIPEFRSPLEDKNSFYYVDKRKSLSERPGIDKGIPVGEIPVPVTMFGLAGDETVHQQMKVFAHTPGAYE